MSLAYQLEDAVAAQEHLHHALLSVGVVILLLLKQLRHIPIQLLACSCLAPLVLPLLHALQVGEELLDYLHL